MEGTLILPQEAANLAFLLDERADHPRPAEGLAQERGQICDSFLGTLGHPLNLVSEQARGAQKQRDDNEGEDCQPPLQDEQHDRNACDGERRANEVQQPYQECVLHDLRVLQAAGDEIAAGPSREAVQ